MPRIVVRGRIDQFEYDLKRNSSGRRRIYEYTKRKILKLFYRLLKTSDNLSGHLSRNL